MVKIYLVRHTEFENPDDICAGRLALPLSTIGLEQANKLKKYFLDKDIRHIYSSEVERCKQTAEIISGNTIPITFDTRLLETFTARQGAEGNNGYNYYGYREKFGGENNTDIQTRMLDFLNDTKWEDNNSYIICSHGDPLYFIYQYYAGIPMPSPIRLGQPIPDYPGYQPRGSVRIMIKEGDNWQVGELIENPNL